MNAETLILVAPCSLLLGAALQILVAKLCSARVKGILAFLACLPAVASVVALIGWVKAGRAIDLNILHWDGPLALVLHVDALSVLFAFMGTGHRRTGAALFHRLHGARQIGHALLRPC
jgi:formate hydrogenlyase subunit 3/multisubunit Na+/H+ antiporter MnhD subunit